MPPPDEPDDIRDSNDAAAAGPGDDERENREIIARTGEPKRDALGNAVGAS